MHLELSGYDDLYRFSIERPADFWREVWSFCGIRGEMGERVIADLDKMPGARFFPDARLNFADNLLRRRDAAPAIIFNGEGARSIAEPRGAVRRSRAVCGCASRRRIRPGDRVAGYMPNLPETIVAALGAAAVGAVWSSCSPDFGVQGVLDRFGQIEPRVLVRRRRLFLWRARATTCWRGSPRSSRALPSVEHTVIVALRRTPAADLRACRGAGRGASGSAARDVAEARVRVATVQPSSLHPVFLRHDGRSEMHRPRRRRDAHSASERAPAALRHSARRSCLLLHDLRLDDVELARDRRWHRKPRCCSTTDRRFIRPATCSLILPTRPGMTLFGTSAKYIDALEQSRSVADRDPPARDRADDDFDGLAAGAARASRLSTSTSSAISISPRSPEAPTSSAALSAGFRSHPSGEEKSRRARSA